jgi:hypothetical protein
VTAAERARWLGELSDALDEARELIWHLGGSGPWSSDALDLAARIEAARIRVESLRLGRCRGMPAQARPEWTKQSLWNGYELGD